MKHYPVKRIAQALIPMGIAIVLCLLLQRCQSQEKEKEIRQLRQQLAHAQTFVPVKHDTVVLNSRDTVTVATSPVIMAELRDLRRQHVFDEQLIIDLHLKLKQLEAVQTTVTETKDSARAAYHNSLKVFSYDDRWSHLEFRPSDSTFYYNIRDSLATLVYHEYKHRFLWWRWGIKGYKVKVVNFNPHSTVTYNTYVKPQK